MLRHQPFINYNNCDLIHVEKEFVWFPLVDVMTTDRDHSNKAHTRAVWYKNETLVNKHNLLKAD